MTRHPVPGRPIPPHLQELIAYLLGLKGGRTFESLAAAIQGAYTASTLRRAVDGRMPTEKVVAAFARAARAEAADVGQAEADEAVRLLRAARAEVTAARVAAARAGRKPYMPRRIATLRGLAAAMCRVRLEAGDPSLSALERAGAGALPRSSLALVLAGKRLPSAGLLAAFLTACDASECVTRELNATRDRLDPRPTPPRAARLSDFYPCADADPEIQAAHDRAERSLEIRALCGKTVEEDWYDRQLREEDERRPAWTLSDAEIEAWASEAESRPDTAPPAGELRSALLEMRSRTRPC
ncbi:hypothetical protein [Streptomyces sp. NPDC088146]|uniref:hypothetical protein n=1 Tax=Streptomyces sp. NPDC088146 TaxID=3365829 RepID=UPI00380A809E